MSTARMQTTNHRGTRMHKYTPLVCTAITYTINTEPPETTVVSHCWPTALSCMHDHHISFTFNLQYKQEILTFFILNLRLDIVNSVTWLHLQCNRFPCQCLDKNLHATSQTQNQVKSRLLLDIVVRQSPAIFQLLARENQTLLVWRDA